MSPALRVVVVLTAVQALDVLVGRVFMTLLPGLLGAADVDPAWSSWVLVGACGLRASSDALAGAFFDRTAALQRPVATVVWPMATVAAVAFLALPWLAGRPLATLGCAALWAVASSAFGVPSTCLLLRYLSPRTRPETASFVAAGAGLAGCLLATVAEALPREGIHRTFAVLALTLWLLGALSFATERSIASPAKIPSFVSERSLAPPTEAAPSAPAETPPCALARLLVATALATVAAQVFDRVVGPWLRRTRGSVGGEAFAVGFSHGVVLALLVAPSLRWFGPVPSASLGCTVAALGAVATAASRGVPTALSLVWTGIGWGTVLTATLAAVIVRAPEDRRARWVGAWFAIQSLATGLRVGVEATLPALDEVMARALVVAVWSIAAVLLRGGGNTPPVATRR